VGRPHALPAGPAPYGPVRHRHPPACTTRVTPQHDILVEAVTDPEPGIAYPRCLTGRRACPPEDSGGVWGYEYLLKILTDPEHEEHHDRLEWLGLDSADQFDPAAFDLAKVNTALSDLAAVRTGNG
jgi:hypothetical protein